MYCSQSHPVPTGPMLVWCSDHVVCTYIRGTVEYSRTVFVRMVNESLWLFRSLGAGSRLDDGGLDVGGGRTHLAVPTVPVQGKPRVLFNTITSARGCVFDELWATSLKIWTIDYTQT